MRSHVQPPHVPSPNTPDRVITPSRLSRRPRHRNVADPSRRRLWTATLVAVVPVLTIALVASVINVVPVDHTVLASEEQNLPDLADPNTPEPTGGGGGPGSPTGTLPAPQPGAPRPWESSMQVTPYSTVNLLNLNLFTVIPVVSWTGIGPDITMNLYHNAATVEADYDTTRGMGFDMGPGWTTSYSAHIDESGDDRVVIADDGTRDEFTWNGTGWDPPKGVHDKLVFGGSKYTLTYKDQSFDEFDADGLLSRVCDEFENCIAVSRVDGRLDSVTDASERPLTFHYDVDNRLERIHDPREENFTPLSGLHARDWDMAYDTVTGHLRTVIDPMTYEISVNSDTRGLLGTIREKYDSNALNPVIREYSFTYRFVSDSYALRYVTDPLGLRREFIAKLNGDYNFQVTYVDRRENMWVYHAWQPVPSVLIDNPPVGRIVNPLGQETKFDFDDDWNMVSTSDALQNRWAFTYDDRGNMLTAASPLHDPGTYDHQQVWTYDAWNNLTSYTDAAEQTTTYHYDEAGYPTLLSRIVEPEATPGSGTATTSFTYYLAPYTTPTCDDFLDECKHGQLASITDPNGVVTSFDYDKYGQQEIYGEGKVNDINVFELKFGTDSASRVFRTERYGHSGRAGASTGYATFDANNHLTGSTCGIPVLVSTASTNPPAIPFPGCAPSLSQFVTTANINDGDRILDPMGRILEQTVRFDTTEFTSGGDFDRSVTSTYDPLGALVQSDSGTNEHAGANRIFDYPYDLTTGIFTRIGPDLVETVTTLDEANRVESVVRQLPQSQGGGELMRANFDYYANGWLHWVTYLNGAQTEYTYDAAGRLTVIDHRNDLGVSFLKLTYGYDNRDLPTSITEESGGVQMAQTDFGYDARGRLTSEMRGGTSAYHLVYEYDKGGNRTRKTDVDNAVEVVYQYDINYPWGPNDEPSANNRLMRYVTCDVSAPGAVCDPAGGSTALISTTYYRYNDIGNAERVITEKANPQGEPRYSSVWLKYAKNGEAVSYVIGETWDDDCANTYEITYAREFRYDGARQRYLNRQLDPAALEAGNVVALSETWTDYDGDAAYADYTVSGSTLTQTALYEPGLARSFDPGNPAATQYYHADLIGTTRLMTDTPGAGVSPNAVSESAFTAFGEQIGATSQRYGYAGAWGYQTDNPANGFPFMHVGARYYDPATGRFLQRDPIGVQGGLNVYQYAAGTPTIAVDPDGEFLGILIGVVTAIVIVAKVAISAYNAHAMAQLAPDRAKTRRQQQDVDDLISEVRNRHHTMHNIKRTSKGIIRNYPNTCFTGPMRPTTQWFRAFWTSVTWLLY